MSVSVHSQSPPRRSGIDKTGAVPRLPPGARPKQKLNVLPPGTNPFEVEPSVLERNRPRLQESAIANSDQWPPHKPSNIAEQFGTPKSVPRRRIPSESMVTLIESKYSSGSSQAQQTSNTVTSDAPFAAVFTDQGSMSSQDKFIAASETSPTKGVQTTGKEKLVSTALEPIVVSGDSVLNFKFWN